jgi:hypothetical protein
MRARGIDPYCRRSAEMTSCGTVAAMAPDLPVTRIFFTARYSYDRDRVPCLRIVRFTADSGFCLLVAV